MRVKIKQTATGIEDSVDEYKVYWDHSVITDGSERVLKRAYVRTTCFIEKVLSGGDTVSYIRTGFTDCSKKDPFCKDTGRRISLSRALYDVESERLSKRERTHFWKAYFEMMGTRESLFKRLSKIKVSEHNNMSADKFLKRLSDEQLQALIKSAVLA